MRSLLRSSPALKRLRDSKVIVPNLLTLDSHEIQFPWIQSSPNVPAASRGYRKPDGTIPSRAELTYLTSVLPPTQNISDMEAVATAREGVEELNYATNQYHL